MFIGYVYLCVYIRFANLTILCKRERNMDVESKIKEDMRSLGCNSDVKISLACFLYMDLVDNKLMYDTEYCYNKDVDTLYVVARRSKSEKMNIYVPIPTFEDVTMDFIGNHRRICVL